MKVLAINGSPHPQGTTSAAMDILSEELAKSGVETEVIQIGGKAIHGCTGCGHCKKPDARGCIFKDDPVNECIEKSRQADGLLLGCPVYYAGIAGTMKSFLDRFFYAGADFRFKAAGAFVCLRRSGGVDAYHQLNHYLHLGQTVIVPTFYWNVVHANANREELMQDQEGVQILQNLGRNMAWLMNCLAEGGKAVALPEPMKRVRTNFIR